VTRASTAPTRPQDVVAAGYDQVAERYLAWSPGRPSAARRRVLELAEATIPRGADVVELGCGAGVPMTATLARGRRLTGVDLSATQLDLARRNVPAATFLQADVTTLERPPASTDAVVAFYVLTHVPREALPGLLSRIHGWLRPGGVFLAAFGVVADPGPIEPDWLGGPMVFSHFSARVNRRLVDQAGVLVEWAEILTEPEDRFDARFLWILARTPSAEPGSAR
jgi:SAM-dependent methyltransferase